MKKILFLSLFLAALFIIPTTTFAHSVVSPAQTSPAKYETFSLNVPTEKDSPTTNIRLLIPESLDKITPYVKSGWNIHIEKEGEKVTAIEWSGGEVPAGQKDVFQFTARTPQKDATLIWKVYQTYADGEVVAWDKEPKTEHHDEKVENPYSTTNVSETASTNELKSPEDAVIHTKENNAAYYIAIIALGISFIALFTARRK